MSRITRHELTVANALSGMSRVTTLQKPIASRDPIRMSGRMTRAVALCVQHYRIASIPNS
jgi:hypothetical protein